ncbi:cold-shock protein [Sinomicrobium weinanense]|uniref:Cold shock domain-containing protein n=1 Tax=Sinomicrobium weinanense TaxID=2842200 RepID=A0A926Q523_9FLAO|nr:cold shock domain-containing protein [Sinomicrobium weinanense]MBC9798624.1 cold shock domain-containing protein [Sinomicrobium weinanense]MBU3122483.1 cold shock domain-containing protein [Sinomicrobium weinanense]
MARSQESFGKKEREKKRLKKKKEKQQKKEERKASGKSSNLEDMLVYVDEYGRLTDTPPDPANKTEIDAESIVIGIPKKEEEDELPSEFHGKVAFFNNSKGYGFIREQETGEKYFVHINGLLDDVEENDKVVFELEKGPRGMNAVRVKRV